MTFEAWIRTQIDLRAEVSVRLGHSADGAEASLMTWSDKVDGTHFWRVSGNSIEHMAFVGTDDTRNHE